MAFSFASSYTPSLLLALTAFLVASTIHPSESVSDQTLASICSETHSPKLCETILRDDPNTLSADLPKLSLISINLTLEQATGNTKTYVDFLHNTTTDNPIMNKGLNKCVQFYQLIGDNLDRAYRLSHGGDYRNSTAELVQSRKRAEGCGAALPINSMAFDALTRLMVSKCDISISVNNYVSRSKA